MPDPIDFTDHTPRFALPYLRPAQAQKELFVNQAFAITDCLLQASIKGVLDSVPEQALEGDSWLVGESATGEWSGHEGHIASFQSASWLFIAPVAGLRIYDESREQYMHYNNGWRYADSIPAVTGGSTIDQELRTAFSILVEVLTQAGIISAQA